jgi:hypothetical protein
MAVPCRLSFADLTYTDLNVSGSKISLAIDGEGYLLKVIAPPNVAITQAAIKTKTKEYVLKLNDTAGMVEYGAVFTYVIPKEIVFSDKNSMLKVSANLKAEKLNGSIALEKIPAGAPPCED